MEKLLIGIVNKALESFVEEALGAEILRKAKVKAGLKQVSFSVTQAYPDADTYTLLGAVCEVGGIEASDALEGFGRFWIRFAESHGYGPLMDSAGSRASALMLTDLKLRPRGKWMRSRIRGEESAAASRKASPSMPSSQRLRSVRSNSDGYAVCEKKLAFTLV
ncbi:MAG: heme NO-binding domain-containing protein, partial [Longimicrobiales bacterium]